MRISDWSSDVCSSDLYTYAIWWGSGPSYAPIAVQIPKGVSLRAAAAKLETAGVICCSERFYRLAQIFGSSDPIRAGEFMFPAAVSPAQVLDIRSEEHTSELQSLMRISYAVFCLKKKNKKTRKTN